MKTAKTYEQLLTENEELSWKLEEATETIEAIRNGKIDAIIVNGENGHRVYTLKTADQTYRLFIEKMSEGAVTINKAGIIISSNTRFASLAGLPLQKVIGLSFDEFIPAEFADQYSAMIASAWNSDCKEELYIQDRAGNKTCCLLSCNILEMGEGMFLSLIITDLTAQKETQKRLELQNIQLEEARRRSAQMNNQLEKTVKERTKDLLISREHFKLLANHMSQMTWTNQPDGNFNYYNQRWYEYTGLSFEESKGWGWQRAVHPDDLERMMTKFMDALHTGSNFEVENRYMRKADGQYRWHLNRAIPLRNESGEIVFWVGTATDIDDQKRELERKDEFIGVASHELKTPLTSLKGYLQLMSIQSKEPLPPMVKNHLDKAHISIRKLQHLVDDLLDVSKINAGRLNYNLETIDMRAIIASCMEIARLMYHSFIFEVDNEMEFVVKGNAERLEQVIMNLVSNAVKYSKEDKRVIIKTMKHEGWGRVAVTDFGIGLRKEQQKRIFDRFYRVEDKKYMTSGLGMGLYISSQIIHTHRGTLGVDSELGKGSTFYFDLEMENKTG